MNIEKDFCQIVRCANCGSHAERCYLHKSNLIRTECSACDSLMITCSLTGRVIEHYITHACARFTRSPQENILSDLEKINANEYIPLIDSIRQPQQQKLFKYEPAQNARIA